LGDDLAVLVPNTPWQAPHLSKERHWLPRIAPFLNLRIPEFLADGQPSGDYPSPWSVCRWLPGDNPTLATLQDPCVAARQLADGVRALQQSDPQDGPSPGAQNFYRGIPLAGGDGMTQAALHALGERVDGGHLGRLWAKDMQAPAWTAPPVWIHGDLSPGNLLAVDGKLSAIIDWGGLGVGDPATDLLPAWNLFREASRETYRHALGVDDATWRRGRGLALSMALVALPYYWESNPAVVRWAQEILAEVVADHAMDVA